MYTHMHLHILNLLDIFADIEWVSLVRNNKQKMGVWWWCHILKCAFVILKVLYPVYNCVDNSG